MWKWAMMATLLVFPLGCRTEKLVETRSELAASTVTLDFGELYPGQQKELQLELYNRGRASLDVRVAVHGHDPLGTALQETPPFSVLEAPAVLPSGASPVRIRFSPNRTTSFQNSLAVEAEGQELIIQLQGKALPVPDCAASDSCHTARFDIDSGRCIEDVLPDGTGCETTNACLKGGQCQAGVCVGETVSCDDGNACTLDVCDPLLGCQFPPAPPCPGNGACQLGVCDPTSGCGFAPAADGTVCGSVSCDAANVCIAGACVVRDPPDGYVCAEASPCQGAGRCQGNVCSRDAAVPLQPSWQLDSAVSSTPSQLHDFVVEPEGKVSLMGFFERPRMNANGHLPQKAESFARRCILWNKRLACADYGAQGTVGVLDPDSGKPLWTYDINVQRPDLYAKVEPGRMFMARVASLGPDRLAALFEAYPLGRDESTQCRAYFLAILDGQGRAVTAQAITDPVLDVCNHPHPFGVASDAQGNLFLAFSPTTTEQAPLYAGTPTLLISYSRDGVFKWKRTETSLYGGELAVAGGLLLPERSATAYQANTGQPLSRVTLVDGRFGRVAVSERLVVPSPLGTFSTAGTRELVAYHYNGARAWTHTLTNGDVFISDQMRLASWRPSENRDPRTVAVVFRSANGYPAITAIDASNGVEAWTCPVGSGSDSIPQLFEVSKGKLTLMERAETCGACDPPFANSSASFVSFTVPGLDLAKVPWPGAFGGADHDHHEDVVIPQGTAH